MRWSILVLVFCALWLPATAAVEIIDLPDGEMDAQYDLTWELKLDKAPTAPLQLAVEGLFTLRLDPERAQWYPTGAKSPSASGFVRLAGKTTAFTLKRREGTVALFQDHRLVFAGPLPATRSTQLSFTQVPKGYVLHEPRYLQVESLHLGDDFMRDPKDIPGLNPRRNKEWIEDPGWMVASFQGQEFPHAAPPKDEKTGNPVLNPWQATAFPDPSSSPDPATGAQKPNVDNTANAFWFMYRGVGPSWVVANAAYPTWDRYYVQAAVKPEYDSEVGLIAAYQDNRNYLLFTWKPSDYPDQQAGPRMELVAVIDGQQRVLGTHAFGFKSGQWYTLRINLGWDTVQALVDGRVYIEAKNPGVAEGRVGLYADGAARPRRLSHDDATATMYVTIDAETGRKIDDAANEKRTTSVIYWDDVRVGSWTTISDLFTTHYATDTTGTWEVKDRTARTATGGRYLGGLSSWARYTARTRVKLPPAGAATVLFHMNDAGTGYAWAITPQGQRLHLMEKHAWKPDVARAAVTLAPNAWADLRVEADGPYVALYCNEQRVMDHYDPTRTAGRCGALSLKNAAAFGPFSITEQAEQRWTVLVHKFFTTDKWIATWSSPEAEWYPSFPPKALVTPMGVPHIQVGAAAPLPTDVPGLYWHKRGHYGDLTATVPLSAAMLNGPILHLASNYDAALGYQVKLEKGAAPNTGQATLLRGAAKVGQYPFTLPAKGQLLFQRRGSYLLLLVQSLDADTDEDASVTEEKVVFAYTDAQPLKTELFGVTVASAALPAARVTVESPSLQDTFETAPVNWTTGEGIWLVMNRYTCQPKWNWFGGFGVGTPHVWSKMRLDGDQTVEVYMGIKMQFDNQDEEYARRYRDMNMSFCTDGRSIGSGYALVRGGRVFGKTVTMLFRRGVMVASTTEAAHLLPSQGQGHRQWPAMRVEKRGGEIKVFLDNKLAITYVDPDPISGGFVAFWTRDNGIMLGRANLSAEKMTVGAPHAFSPTPPLPDMVAEDPNAAPAPTLALNGATLNLVAFEKPFAKPAAKDLGKEVEGFKPSDGISASLYRFRDAKNPVNTYLYINNQEPAGDFGTRFPITGSRIDSLPLLHFDYNFEQGAQVNLYARVQGVWYEVLLTGSKTKDANVVQAGKADAVADGRWRHLALNLGERIEGLMKLSGKPVTDLVLQELVLADWGATAEARAYGFGNNPGHTYLCLDNVVLLPAPTGKEITLSWSGPAADTARWKVTVDTNPWTEPSSETTNRSLTVPPAGTLRFLHVKAQVGDTWSRTLHLPIPAKE